MENSLTRREFVHKTALGAAAVTASVVGAPSIGVAGANGRINIGIIGLGVIGNAHRKELLKIKGEDNCSLVAVCDIYTSRMSEYAEAVREGFGEAPRQYHDYREMLANPDIDKIIIATPEHWHEKMLIAAVKARKHVYCEKPMTHNSVEALRVLKAIENSDSIVQIGVQGMSDNSYQAAQDVIKQGMLGQVVQAQIDYVRRYSEERGLFRQPETEPDAPKPEDLDWEAFLGPAWKRPWDPRRYHHWRNYWDYSGGIATDLFVHRITRIIKACDLKEPVRGVGMGGIWKWDDGRDIPDNFEMVLEYPGGPTVYCLGTMANNFGVDHCIRGYKATLVFDEDGFKVYKQHKKSENSYSDVIYEHKKIGGEDQDLHHKNHHTAMRAGDPSLLNCPPELGYYGVVAVDLANESYTRKRYMKWSKQLGRVVPA